MDFYNVVEFVERLKENYPDKASYHTTIRVTHPGLELWSAEL